MYKSPGASEFFERSSLPVACVMSAGTGDGPMRPTENAHRKGDGPIRVLPCTTVESIVRETGATPVENKATERIDGADDYHIVNCPTTQCVPCDPIDTNV